MPERASQGSKLQKKKRTEKEKYVYFAIMAEMDDDDWESSAIDLQSLNIVSFGACFASDDYRRGI